MNDSYKMLYHDFFAAEPPSVTRGESTADIFNAAKGFMAGFDFTMQLQVGCPGGCLFCYVPNGRYLTPIQVKGRQGELWGSVVRNKQKVAKKLQRHLISNKLADKTIYWSGITDPYAAPPSMTKEVWRVLCEAPVEYRPRRIAIQTRFRPDRDIDLLAKYNETTKTSDKGPAIVVSYSIGSDRNDLLCAWERATPNYEKRMKTIETLCQANICVIATLSPFSLWNDLIGTLDRLEHQGVAYITVLFFKEQTKSASTPPRFLAYLRKNYPRLLDPCWQQEQIKVIRNVFGEQRVLEGQAGFASLTKPQDVV